MDVNATLNDKNPNSNVVPIVKNENLYRSRYYLLFFKFLKEGMYLKSLI
jgi:hypothetical protein